MSCASTGTPSGGPRDTAPPVMDTARSAQNRLLNSKPRVLEYYFDEFIEVRDPIKEVLVSPPLTYIPKVTHRGKKVTFAFDEKEVLRDDATYTINFGGSIVDFHESNKLVNFSYVFATGNNLDSMELKGNIIDARTNEPEIDMVVFLYDNLSDSIVNKEKPFYFARPDKSGNFEFKNVKSDTFRLIAIKDENLNYRYDLTTEKIAFYDSLIILKDSSSFNITMTASNPIPTLKTMSTDSKTYGKINILCNTTPRTLPSYKISSDRVNHAAEISGDSINVYYETDTDSFDIYILSDTITIKPRGKKDFLKKSRLQKIYSNSGAQILPKDSIVITFNYPLKDIDSDKIIVFDSIGLLDDVVVEQSTDKKSITFKYPWVAGENYTISLDSGVITSIYSQVIDSLGVEFSVLKPENTAAMNVNISDLDSTAVYIIHVLRDQKIVYQTKVDQQNSMKFLIKGLVPDRYNIEIIKDINTNGIWDAGDYWQKRQPEPYKFIKGESIRENRETDVNISWKNNASISNQPNSQSSGFQLNIKK
jgi:hypothetical protein